MIGVYESYRSGPVVPLLPILPLLPRLHLGLLHPPFRCVKITLHTRPPADQATGLVERGDCC